MMWSISHRADPTARVIADRHYNRQKPGSPQFVPPGRCLVLRHDFALWITSWPFAQYVRHAWAGAWVCSVFRRESECEHRASDLIRAALACTLWRYGPPPEPHGMITFVDESKVRRKRDAGRCYRRAGFSVVGRTAGGLLALGMTPSAAWPAACAPTGSQGQLFAEVP